ncbi:hypothetical protein B0H11DRAFT_1164627 [Mycena galericulata]|nr:hypothetical protein B0H11DRAFT_1164627 [Mycena galericulata]
MGERDATEGAEGGGGDTRGSTGGGRRGKREGGKSTGSEEAPYVGKYARRRAARHPIRAPHPAPGRPDTDPTSLSYKSSLDLNAAGNSCASGHQSANNPSSPQDNNFPRQNSASARTAGAVCCRGNQDGMGAGSGMRVRVEAYTPDARRGRRRPRQRIVLVGLRGRRLGIEIATERRSGIAPCRRSRVRSASFLEMRSMDVEGGARSRCALRHRRLAAHETLRVASAAALARPRPPHRVASCRGEQRNPRRCRDRRRRGGEVFIRGCGPSSSRPYRASWRSRPRMPRGIWRPATGEGGKEGSRLDTVPRRNAAYPEAPRDK